MPSTAFADEELYNKIEKINSKTDSKDEEYPEQEFLASCLKVGLTTRDLENLTYVEIMKILYSFLDKKNTENNVRRATQEDWDNFM